MLPISSGMGGGKLSNFAKGRLSSIGPEGHAHRWTAPRKITQRVQKIYASTISLVERLCDMKIYALSVLGYIGSISAPDEATLKCEALAFSVLPQVHTMPFPATYYLLVPCGDLDPTCLVSTLSASRAEHTHQRFRQLVGMMLIPFLLSAPIGKRNSHSLASRGFCPANLFTSRQNSWTDQSFSCCIRDKESHRRRGTNVSNWMPG